MAEITFHANIMQAATPTPDDPTTIGHGAGSGLGFFGNGFGISVPVGQYQDNTFVTNSNGTASGVKCSNTKYASASGVSHNSGSEIDNENMPNYYAPLNIRFTHSEAVKVQNCKLRIFDRNNIANIASGVSTQVYEVRHPYPVEGNSASSGPLAFRGRSTHDWVEYEGGNGVDDASQFDTTLTSSPGMSGLNTSSAETLPTGDGSYLNWLTNEGASHSSTRHDWFVALSSSPDEIGSKTDYGLYFTVEYL